MATDDTVPDRLMEAIKTPATSTVGDYTAYRMKSLAWRLRFEIEPGSYEAHTQAEELERLSSREH